MLPRPLRLDLRHIPDFFERADRAYGSLVSLRFLPEFDSVQTTQWVIIVSKHAGRGAVRVQIKRRMRHALMAWLAQQSPDFRAPQQVVVLVRRLATQHEYERALSGLLTATARSSGTITRQSP